MQGWGRLSDLSSQGTSLGRVKQLPSSPSLLHPPGHNTIPDRVPSADRRSYR